MFKITLAEPSYLLKPVGLIKELIGEANIKIDKDKLSLLAMDSANVSMIEFNLLSSAFTEYDVKQDVDLSVNFNNFHQLLKTANANSMISLSLDKKKLFIEIKGETNRSFHLPLIELTEEEKPKKTNLKFKAKVELNAKQVNNEIDAHGIVAESTMLVCSKDKFAMIAQGDLSDATTVFNEPKISLEGEKVACKYSIEYLKKFFMASTFCDDVTIEFSNDHPVLFTFKQLDKFSLQFTLAPRVEAD